MADLHADDLNFWRTPIPHSSVCALFSQRTGVEPLSIRLPDKVDASYHWIAIVELPAAAGGSGDEGEKEGRRWTKCVLRVACLTLVKRHTTIPVPEVYFFDSTEDNVLGLEYICMEYIEAPSLDSCWMTLTPSALSHVLDQLVAFYVQLHRIPLPSPTRIGGLYFADSTPTTSTEPSYTSFRIGPSVDELHWQEADIARYWHALANADHPAAGDAERERWARLADETFESLNPLGPFDGWVDQARAYLSAYRRQIDLHPRLEFMTHLLPRLDELLGLLDTTPSPKAVPRWLTDLRTSTYLNPTHLSHRDTHFGNLLVRPNASENGDGDGEPGQIVAVLDWEFAGATVEAPVDRFADVLEGCLVSARRAAPAASSSTDQAGSSVERTWPAEFVRRLSDVDWELGRRYAKASEDLSDEEVLGKEGVALRDVSFRFVRACVEVGVRQTDAERVHLAKTIWLAAAERALDVLLP